MSADLDLLGEARSGSISGDTTAEGLVTGLGDLPGAGFNTTGPPLLVDDLVDVDPRAPFGAGSDLDRRIDRGDNDWGLNLGGGTVRVSRGRGGDAREDDSRKG